MQMVEPRSSTAFLVALFGIVAAGPAPAQGEGPAAAQACFACHGVGGASSQPLIPILAGQNARYLYLQLKDFKEGRRTDAQMSPVAAALSKEDMMALAAYFAEQQPAKSGFRPDPAKAAKGKDVADATLCTMCHQGNYQGQNEIPRLAGQHYEYLKKQLAAFKAKTRTNDAGNMTSVAATLKDEDIDNIAQYLAGM